MGFIGKAFSGFKKKIGITKRPSGQQKTVTKQPTVATMSEEDRLARDMAEMAYQKPEERGAIGDYQLDTELSDKNTAVYHNAKTNKNYIGFRGTADLKDVYTDVADKRGNILRGTQKNNPMYKADLALFDKVKGKYGGTTAVSGHSLGGSRAQNVSQQRNVKGQAFNLGRGFDKGMLMDKAKCMMPKMMRPEWCDKFTSHHIKGDLLSVANRGSYGKHKNYAAKNPLKAHFMSNFF